MNQDIIDYLEGYWVKWKVKCNNYCYIATNTNGDLVYYPATGILRLCGTTSDTGYEVQIQDLAHLIQLEALL